MKKLILPIMAAVCLIAVSQPVAAVSPNIARQMGNAIADAVDKVMPSVVVVRTATTRNYIDLFRGRRFQRDIPGQGSGVIISDDGYVLTSNHVIANVNDIEVELSSGITYPAQLVGRDAITDLAVLKIIAEHDTRFTGVAFGDSEALRVGEFVIAIGAPFSLVQHLQGSVTLGIVSQKERTIGILPYEDFIQTDAPINPGNSGGPLVDVDGNIVGINTLIQKGGQYSEGNIGIGFAVPIDLARRVSDSITETGSVRHPWLGITMRATEDGVFVHQVIQGSPAEKGGIRSGDIILEVEENAVADPVSVKRHVFVNSVGDDVELKIVRNLEIMDLEITLEAMPEVLSLRR